MLGESLRERFGERPEVPIRHEAIKLLASDTRLSILKLLDKRRMTVSELSRALGLNKSTVHEHLGKLVEGGLLRRDESAEREWVYYELTKTARYVLQPASARFVLLMGAAVAAAVVAVAFLHVALTAGQGLALATDVGAVPAGEAKVWSVDVTRAGLLGTRQPATDARLYLLSPEQAAEYQLSDAVPADARPLGPREGLAAAGPGRYTFRAVLEPGVHYLLASEGPGAPAGLLPLRAEAVRVAPRQPTVLLGVDPPQVEVEVRFREAPVAAGMVQAVDQRGQELAQVPVLNGRAVMHIAEPADEVRFRFKPEGPGSSFADAAGHLRAQAPHVAFGPAEIPLLVASEVRVVVDDPLQGPRAGAPVALVRGDGRTVATGTTDATGAGSLHVRIAEPGDLILKAGDVEVGRVAAKPGIRTWVEPGPHWEGQRIRVRTLHLGEEPRPVAGATILLDGREVGATDHDGWLTLQFGLGGRYGIEARREGYVPAATSVEVLARTGYAPIQARTGFALAAASLAPAGPAPARPHVEVADPAVAVGGTTQVWALLANPDPLPRVVRAEFRADGALLEARGVEVPGAGEAWVRFDYAPQEPGTHLVGVNDLPPQRVEALPAVPEGAPAPRAVPAGSPLAPLAALALAGLAAWGLRRRAAP